MAEIKELTRNIVTQMPPDTRFRSADAAVVTKHQEKLLALEPKIIEGFYNTLFDHEPTKAIFEEGERPDREETLRQWWQRTVSGKFDMDYWSWQALVGLIHVKRQVKNPMMIAMWGWILNTLRTELHGEMEEAEFEELMGSFERLAATVQSLTAESYLEHYIEALCGATGFQPALLQRMVETEVDNLLKSVGR